MGSMDLFDGRRSEGNVVQGMGDKGVRQWERNQVSVLEALREEAADESEPVRGVSNPGSAGPGEEGTLGRGGGERRLREEALVVALQAQVLPGGAVGVACAAAAALAFVLAGARDHRSFLGHPQTVQGVLVDFRERERNLGVEFLGYPDAYPGFPRERHLQNDSP